ncbi:hypothetical protein GCM10010271_03620 [Streptomyces kurssanovii]|nr:hypothetical protein GCM10010271_03620 [Streptomyces kurssanovii]
MRAGVNLDGDLFAPLPAPGSGGRPFMMTGAEATDSPADERSDWPDAWARLDGWKRWLTVAGSKHFSFPDLPVPADQLALTDPAARLSGQRGCAARGRAVRVRGARAGIADARCAGGQGPGGQPMQRIVVRHARSGVPRPPRPWPQPWPRP